MELTSFATCSCSVWGTLKKEMGKGLQHRGEALYLVNILLLCTLFKLHVISSIFDLLPTTLTVMIWSECLVALNYWGLNIACNIYGIFLCWLFVRQLPCDIGSLCVLTHLGIYGTLQATWVERNPSYLPNPIKRKKRTKVVFWKERVCGIARKVDR